MKLMVTARCSSTPKWKSSSPFVPRGKTFGTGGLCLSSRRLGRIDPILRDYYFCNIYRPLDRVSRYGIEHVLRHDALCRDILFNVIIARLFNEPATFDLTGFTPWGEFNAGVALVRAAALNLQILSLLTTSELQIVRGHNNGSPSCFQLRKPSG
jgi:hypothetical protein